MYVITRLADPLSERRDRLKLKMLPDNYFARRRLKPCKGKGMSEVGVVRASPDSDCNSNHHGSALYLSNTSSQDIDFVQDNSDYQWFLDYGYRDGSTNHHTSILSLPEAYEAGDNYYDALSKNMDANLAEADMESFRTEDIHALLTNLPPMCSTDQLSQETHRQGESYAEVSGSMMGKFDLDSFMSPQNSSQGEDCSANSNSMSICKSELLFSPVKETPMPGANFSVDSLDCDIQDLMLTCQANKDNYTIAFEGSVTMYSEDSDYPANDKSANSNHQERSVEVEAPPPRAKKILETSMTQSDSGGFTTWSKLKKRGSDDQLRRPSGNNNNSEDEGSGLGLGDAATKSRSMPNLHKRKTNGLVANSVYLKSQSNSSETETVKRRPVKVFDIHHQIQTSSGSGSVSDMATSIDASSCDAAGNRQPNFNLVKLFMKQKSMSTEGMSMTMDQLSSTENWPGGSNSSASNSSDAKNADHLKNLELSNDQKTCDSSSTRTYDLIAEEPEEETSKSESVEQLSESVEENVNNNDSFAVRPRPKAPSPGSFLNVLDRSIQTSQFSEILNLKHANKMCAGPHPRDPVKIIEPSFLNRLKKEGEVQKPVYVLYPNYVLPDLGFLNEKTDVADVLFVPHRAPKVVPHRRRPFSFNDIESLKRKGFDHVKDWESLNVLLPQEYRKLLADVPEVSSGVKVVAKERPSFVRSKKRPSSCELAQTNVSSSSSTATQPSSGYRGSSSLLTDSQNSPAPQNNLNPLFVYRYDSVTSSEASLVNSDKRGVAMRCVSLPQDAAPPRPPLPRGILRKGDVKRYGGAYETSEEDLAADHAPKSRHATRNKRLSETEDEGVDAGASSSSLDDHVSVDELIQLEEFLKLSGFSTDDDRQTEESLTHLRSYVGKFLTLKINQEGSDRFGKKTVSFAEKVNVSPRHHQTFNPPNNSPNASAFLPQQRNCQPKTLADMPICEENETSPNYSSPRTTPVHLCKNASDNYLQKRSLINGVLDAVEQVMQHFSAASDQQELNHLGDSGLNPACAKLTLTTLCPALYAVLSDGLRPCLETSFGAINNSVWQVVEASAQQGPLTKALNDLVMKINGEDVISEGLIKFNAFIFGLLNVRSLDAWTSYLRTRESVLKKHYTADSLLVTSHTGGTNLRSMLDAMIAALQPLAFLPFQLDLLFEYKQLHLSFKRMDSYHQPLSPTRKHSTSPNFKQFMSPKYALSSHSSESDDASTATVRQAAESAAVRRTKERPRSCLDPSKPSFKLGEDVNSVAKRRWSGIALSSRLYQAYDKLSKEDEEYADSLENPEPEERKPIASASPLRDEPEPESLDSNFSDEKPLNGRRFKKLQRKWEMLSGKESTEEPSSPTHPAGKSKIPRPVSSPVKPSGIPVLISPTSKQTQRPQIKTAPAVKGATKSRTSRVDRVENGEGPRHVQRPSSLPYKAANQNKGSKMVPPRRAASSSLNRRPLGAHAPSKTPKVVRTVGHRLPSESGHLSYNEGEMLRVVLEVDDKWWLCCRGTQKGLVPKSAVIADTGPF
ncbi:uncharacterized protein LOC132701627 isoform X2 [Cylas formicarius]|uniref:uncharacterized protein LOC132701627 isoform X2 n=1 Tax=Cylas formicarius TaxID=197179 RepID=UPI002958D422|nr:uncharacterized protein LOC132701627 isoform X2 [Cylas formicarius]XP_060525718.1 uncharacterized protein LOC132701627 isoform X2 [Cylas formicarius]XP_060525719.1 uncharacterized protein LOC132701627 isoform X2 [Cylas formicarius]XP_060525720.1 uncharacterized protein LOC132701627 isoform X2 [Cylas formicarius]XP_060525721.1 uncharacterized protein LOC132701627 isoform X2 [Cylas formicarius]XP_060525722.1 uncharacterized protein LOC132701627 isoform X2 [Cylas formicarius]XP_060525723.1 un